MAHVIAPREDPGIADGMERGGNVCDWNGEARTVDGR